MGKGEALARRGRIGAVSTPRVAPVVAPWRHRLISANQRLGSTQPITCRHRGMPPWRSRRRAQRRDLIGPARYPQRSVREHRHAPDTGPSERKHQYLTPFAPVALLTDKRLWVRLQSDTGAKHRATRKSEG